MSDRRSWCPNVARLLYFLLAIGSYRYCELPELNILITDLCAPFARSHSCVAFYTFRTHDMPVRGDLQGTTAEFPFFVGGRRHLKLPGSGQGGHRLARLPHRGK